MIYQILEWTCTIIALVAFLYRLATLPRGQHRDPTYVALCVYFFCSFFSFVVGLDLVSPHIARLFQYRNTTIILSHSAVIMLTAAQLVVLSYWTHSAAEARRQSRRIILAYGIALAALVTVFLATLPMERQGTSATVSLLNMNNSAYAGYLVLLTMAIAAGQIVTVRVSWSLGRAVTAVWLRRGMRLVAAGAVLILGYCTMRVLQIVCVRLDVDISRWNPVQWLAGDVGSLLELFGWTAPGWGPALSGAARWAGDYRRYQRLRPLWAALHRATPEIALDGSRSRCAELLLPKDLNYRLYRRVIEILDGERALRAYLDHRPRDEVRRDPRDRSAGQTQARTEALWLHAALRAKARGISVISRPSGANLSGSVVGSHPDDLRGETARLVLVAREFRRTGLLAAGSAPGGSAPGGSAPGGTSPGGTSSGGAPPRGSAAAGGTASGAGLSEVDSVDPTGRQR